MEKINYEEVNTLTALARYYNVSRRTMYNWIYPIRKEILDMYPYPKKYISVLLPKQIKFIKDYLG